MPETPILVDMIGNLGALGVLFWLVLQVTRYTIPKIMASFEKNLRDTREDFGKQLESQRQDLLKSMEDHRESYFQQLESQRVQNEQFLEMLVPRMNCGGKH